MKIKLLMHLLIFLSATAGFAQKYEITGELKKWHKVMLTFEGAATSEFSDPNPFTDYRLDVTFVSGTKSYTVPGYFIADGKPDQTSATQGSKWRVNFSPDEIGTWTFTVSFKKGKNVAIDGGGESAGFMDGEKGSFDIKPSDKTGVDLRARGRLKYIGEHYLQYTDSKELLVKAGADSPENIFHYYEFDGTYNGYGKQGKVQQFMKYFQPHANDYSATDAEGYLWGSGKGKNLLGVVKYLADQGMNSMSIMTFSVDGDDRNVFPYVLNRSPEEFIEETQKNQSKAWERNFFHKDRFDVSKLEQWEKVLEYCDKKGIFLDIKLSEIENNKFHYENDSDFLRKLYYREIIARFAHHLGIQWNISEEISMPNEQAQAAVTFIKKTDPYGHLRVIHTFPNGYNKNWQTYQMYYESNLGTKSDVTGASMQITLEGDSLKIHKDVKQFVIDSEKAGRKWVVSNDEQGSADIGTPIDPNGDYMTRYQIIWATLMAGGNGFNYYYGYKTQCTDLTCQDHRTRAKKFAYAKIAMDFFKNLQPYLTKMQNADEITPDASDFVFAKTGEVYTIYRPKGGSTTLTLPKGNWYIQWYNPREGGPLTAAQKLGKELVAPDTNDWVALIKKK